MKRLILALIAVFFISGCSTLQVKVDNDPEYDFSSLNKFSVIYTKKDDNKRFFRNKLSKSLIKYFEDKGYIYVEKKEADFYILFHLDVQKRSEIETNYQEMGMSYRDYYNRIYYIGDQKYIDPFPIQNRSSVTTTRLYEYEEAQLIVEILDVKQNVVFWQSIAEDELSNSASSLKQTNRYIKELLEKMFNEFPKK